MEVNFNLVARYAIPLVQKILEGKSLSTGSKKSGYVKALILVPSKELSQQAAANIKVGGAR